MEPADCMSFSLSEGRGSTLVEEATIFVDPRLKVDFAAFREKVELEGSISIKGMLMLFSTGGKVDAVSSFSPSCCGT